MPLTKSAIKAARQSTKRQSRLQPYKTKMKTMMRKLQDAAKAGKGEAQKLLPEVYKVIDTAAKKQLIHPRNADRKKALMAKLVAGAK